MSGQQGDSACLIAILLAWCLIAAGCSTTRYVALSHDPFGPVAPGDHVEIVTRAGETIAGTVDGRGEDTLTVDGRPIARADMASLQVRQGDVARTSGVVAGMALGPALVIGLIFLLVPGAVIAMAI